MRRILMGRSKRLTWKEICKRYPCQRVCLTDVKYVGNTPNVESAVVKYTEADMPAAKLAGMAVMGDGNMICYSTGSKPSSLGSLLI